MQRFSLCLDVFWALLRNVRLMRDDIPFPRQHQPMRIWYFGGLALQISCCDALAKGLETALLRRDLGRA